MKPTRDTPGIRLSNLPKERRSAMVALVLLVGVLGSLMLYQRITATDWKSQAEVAKPPASPAVIVDGAVPTVVAPNVPSDPPAPTELHLPLAGRPTALTQFGPASSAILEDFRTDPGVDYPAALNEPVLAAAGGTVTSIERDPFYGMTITLDNGGHMETRYSGLGKALVAQGAKVKAGQPLGAIGVPGDLEKAMGHHLHFEVRIAGTAVDPANYLSSN